MNNIINRRSYKGKNNPRYGTHWSKQTRRKIIKALKGNNYKYNISKKFLIREYIKNKKPITEISKQLGCSFGVVYIRLKRYNILIRNRSQARIIGELSKGKKNPRFGKPPRHGKKSKYKKIWMRSSWETKYAKYLDKNKIKWKYEPKRFDLGNMTYTPDFYLPKENKYIEIKGWWRGNAKKKFDRFKKQYPNTKIELLMKPELKKLGVL